MGKVNDKIKEVANYIDSGLQEVGNDMGISLESKTIITAKRGKMPDSTFVLQSFAQTMLKNRKRLSTTAKDLIFYFIGYVGYGNWIGMNIETICEELGKKRSIVLHGLKQLKEINLIVSVPDQQDKRRNVYWINPNAMYRGSAIERTKQIKEAKKNQLELGLFDNKDFVKLPNGVKVYHYDINGNNIDKRSEKR
jgi:hypothetical protein